MDTLGTDEGFLFQQESEADCLDGQCHQEGGRQNDVLKLQTADALRDDDDDDEEEEQLTVGPGQP